MDFEKERPNVFNLTFWIIAILAGILSSIAPGIVFVFCLTALLFFLIQRNTPQQDRNFVTSVILAAILIRLALLVILQVYCYPRTENVIYGKLDIFGDAQDNIFKGLNLGDFLQGKADAAKINIKGVFSREYNVHGKIFFNALYFALFGKDIISLKFINFLCIALTSWFAYDLTRRIYPGFSGRLAMVFILFWPTIILWSVTDLKDSHFIVSLMGLLWSQEKIFATKQNILRFKYSCYFILFSFYALSLRFNLLLTMFLALFVITFLLWFIKKYVYVKKLLSLRVILFSGFILLIIFIFKNRFIPYSFAIYKSLISINKGFLSSGGINYDIFTGESDIYNFALMPKYLWRGFFHFLLEPLPWKSYSPALRLLSLQIFIWYSMLFFSILGLFNISQRGNFKKIFLILVFFFLYILINGILVPNIGTGVRLRDAVLSLVAIFAACGIMGRRDGASTSQTDKVRRNL